jgi:hypothetical protein
MQAFVTCKHKLLNIENEALRNYIVLGIIVSLYSKQLDEK